MSMTQGAIAPPHVPPMIAAPPISHPALQPGAPPMAQSQASDAPPSAPMMEVFDAQKFMSAIQLLRDERQRGFRIDIETDSTIVPDQAGERKDAMDMVQSIGAFMQSALPMVQAMPAILPLLGKILLFMVRRFPISSELESAFEDAIAKLEQASGQAMPGQGGEQAKTAADQAAAQAKIQVAQVQSQTAQLKAQNDLSVERLKQQTAVQDHQMDMREIQTEAQAQAANDQRDTQRTLLQEQMAQQEHARQMTPAPVVPLAPQKLPFMAGPRQ